MAEYRVVDGVKLYQTAPSSYTIIVRGSEAILDDFAQALGLKPRSKPLSFEQAKKLTDKAWGQKCYRGTVSARKPNPNRALQSK